VQGGRVAPSAPPQRRRVCPLLEHVLDAAAGWDAPPLRLLPFAWMWGVAAAQVRERERQRQRQRE
jgi:hypothetical protein